MMQITFFDLTGLISILSSTSTIAEFFKVWGASVASNRDERIDIELETKLEGLFNNN